MALQIILSFAEDDTADHDTSSLMFPSILGIIMVPVQILGAHQLSFSVVGT